MADIVKFPDLMSNEETFELGLGSKITITAPEGERLEVHDAVYMLEYVKYRILKMMDEQ